MTANGMRLVTLEVAGRSQYGHLLLGHLGLPWLVPGCEYSNQYSNAEMQREF